MSQPDHDVTAVLLDIEGTTTSISFVHDVLFPFARAHFAAFLERCWDEPAVQADVDLFRTLAKEDIASGVEGAVAIPDTDDAAQVRGAVLHNAMWMMDNDRKATALKSIQGKIWKDGYANGELLADVFEDVPGAFKAWQHRQIPVYIYSSGSIAAQKLLFAHTHHGDLRPLLAGHFDTTTGSKKERQSYQTIAQTIGTAPEQILFATDVVAEADAAVAAGMRAIIMDRPGNKPQPEHAHPVKSSLSFAEA